MNNTREKAGMGTVNDGVARVGAGRGMERGAQRVLRAQKPPLCESVMGSTCHCAPVQTTEYPTPMVGSG